MLVSLTRKGNFDRAANQEGLSEERHSLPVQSREPYDGAQTRAAREIKADDFVLGGAIEIPIGRKTQSARSVKLGLTIRGEHAHELSVACVIFPDGRDCIRRSEWALAGNKHVAVWRDHKIQRTEIGVPHEPG